ncbi:MAG: hypothetical protein ACEPOZ_14225 [Marinifilaceae bacterium]
MKEKDTIVTLIRETLFPFVANKNFGNWLALAFIVGVISGLILLNFILNQKI